MLLFFKHQGTIGKLFACRFQITIDIEGIVKMNLIFCHSKKSAKIAENAQIPNFGSISTHRKYFFLQKKIFSQFLYIKNHWKNTGTFDFENFCNFQPYLIDTAELCAARLAFFAWKSAGWNRTLHSDANSLSPWNQNNPSDVPRHTKQWSYRNIGLLLYTLQFQSERNL